MSRPEAAEELVARRSERWNDCQGLGEANLLRLAILRDLAHDFHAQKSRCLALGERDSAKSIKTWEDRLQTLRTASKLDGALIELLTSADKQRKRTRLLPQALFTHIEKEKFERYDREWEHEIAAEAASLGWNFWTLNSWVQIEKVEEWGNHLTDIMLPHGVVLFCEAAQTSAQPDAPADLWQGKWFVVISPTFRQPEFGVDHLPGTATKPSAPQWKLFFSPKKT